MSQGKISLDRLKILLSVAETGSLTDTAAQLMMSVSAVSQQISKLEREVKIPLMERLPRGVQLTAAGTALAQHALAIDRNISAALAEMDEFKNLHRGRVRISTFPTFAASLMPEVIHLYRIRHPQIDIHLKSARQNENIDALLRRDSEIATLWDYPWLPLERDDLNYTELLIEPTMLLVPKEHHSLSRRKTVALEELAHEKWVTREDHPVASVLHTICHNAGFTPKIAMVTTDYQELQGMVSAGIGLAIAPKLAVMNPNANVRVLNIQGNPAPRRILLAGNAQAMLSPSAQEAVRIFKEISLPYLKQGAQ
ncbi:MAG: LysR family transcriptional regulator [Rothia sp. (in: high G+C Gram-positive bacteria)]|nr:LysR family transcriptional regulator [Rothia sp. (in: high G+C Gram-positive bacteria)]